MGIDRKNVGAWALGLTLFITPAIGVINLIYPLWPPRWPEAETTNGARESTVSLVEDVIAPAIDSYKAVNGSYPTSINDLVPQHFDKLPMPLYGAQHWDYHLQDDGQRYFVSFGTQAYAPRSLYPVFIYSNVPFDVNDNGAKEHWRYDM